MFNSPYPPSSNPFSEDILGIPLYMAVEKFLPVTKDPRPFERIVALAGPSTTVRDTFDPAWRAHAADLLHDGCKSATIKRNLHTPLNALASFIQGLRREKGCDTPPMLWLTPEQADDLLEVSGTPERYGVEDPQLRMRTAIAFMLGTGCRTGESFVVEAKDINWNSRECKIRGEILGAGKTKASRRIAYLPAKAASLMDHLPEEGPIILNRKGRPFPIRNHGGGQIRKELEKLCKAADLPERCTPYTLRHSMATWTYALKGMFAQGCLAAICQRYGAGSVAPGVKSGFYIKKRSFTCGVCQTSCPLVSCSVSDFRGVDFGFGVEPDGSDGLPVAGFA